MILWISPRHGTCLRYSLSFVTIAAGNVLRGFFYPTKQSSQLTSPDLPEWESHSTFLWQFRVGKDSRNDPFFPNRFSGRFTVWAAPGKRAGTIRHFYSSLCLCCLFLSLHLFLRCFSAVTWSVIFCRQGCFLFPAWPVALMLSDNLIVLVPLENWSWKKRARLIEFAKRKSPCFYLNCV